AARHARWARPELAGLAEFSGWIGGDRMRRPYWRGLLDPADVHDDGWALPPEPVTAAPVPAAPMLDEPAPPAASPEPPPVPAAPGAAGAATEARRLEQHFVYNSLNTIAALIRTDPGRARDLLMGFADLSRAVDQVGGSTLGAELAAVQGYLQLEQARFGPRLQVAVDVAPALHPIPVTPTQVLAAVREAVQRDIE